MKRIALALLGCAAAQIFPTNAASAPWREPTYTTQAENTSAAELLQAFAAQQGLTLQLNTTAESPVSGRFENVPTRQFIDSVCESTGLCWFWDGTSLQIESVDQTEMKVLKLDALTARRATEVLLSLGFDAGPTALAAAVRGEEGILTLSGGKKMVATLEPVLNSLNTLDTRLATEAWEQEERDQAAALAADSKIDVRLFRLTYASAVDINVRGSNSQSTIPGVVRALQNIMQTGTGDLSAGAVTTLRPNQLTSLRGTGLAAVGREPANTPGTRTESRPEAPAAESQPLIQADPRLNAVIVRDQVGRFPMYERLISQLDIPSDVIEISAAVVDIDTDNNRYAGVEFLSFGRISSGIIQRTGFDGNFGGSSTDTVTNSQSLVSLPGLATSVLVPVGSFELLGRVRALEDKGEAQLVTSPSIITMDNVEANLRQDDTIYVRVAGTGTGASSDLYNVRTGVQLRVTPSVIRKDGEVSFRMVVEVQDGSFTDVKVDGVPGTRESAISTQAVVPASKTLLIGGYFVERRSDKIHQVPGLGNLPLLGRLFRSTNRTSARSQRFFFITPRLVDINSEARSHHFPGPTADNPPSEAAPDPALNRVKAEALVGRALKASTPVSTEP
jgi:type III secretion protein C